MQFSDEPTRVYDGNEWVNSHKKRKKEPPSGPDGTKLWINHTFPTFLWMVWLIHPRTAENDNDEETGEWVPWLHDTRNDAEFTMEKFQCHHQHHVGLKLCKKKRPGKEKFEDISFEDEYKSKNKT